jgi:hypothetical protein
MKDAYCGDNDLLLSAWGISQAATFVSKFGSARLFEGLWPLVDLWS